MRSSFAEFKRCERGSYLVYFAIAVIPLLAMAGLGVDLARAYLAKSRLQSAVDAAAIAMGSADGTEAEIMALGRTFFYANYPNDFWAVPAEPVITLTHINPGDPSSRLSDFHIAATAEVNTLFFHVLNDATHAETYSTLNIGSASNARSEVKGLEVVLVLDVTWSMVSNSTAEGDLRIEAMRNAAKVLVDILFGNQPPNDPAPLLRIAVVPYNTAVNIGTTNLSYVFDADASLFGDTTWFGCVQTRQNGHDATDEYLMAAPPSDGRGPWPAYRWPLEPDRDPFGSVQSSSRACTNRAGSNGVDDGDYHTYDDPLATFDTFNGTHSYDHYTYGPNKSCPQPLLPLNAVRSQVDAYLDNVTAVDATGTITATGMVWGWRVISQSAPFTEGTAYDDVDWQKAIIVLTDGQQTLVSQPRNCDDSTAITRVPPVGAGLPYEPWSFDPASRGMAGNPISRGSRRYWSAYGYADPADSAPLGSGSIVTLLENRLRQVCLNIKAVEDPVYGGPAIDLFAITFGSISESSTLGQLMKNDCTTDSANNYFNAPNSATLQAAFEEIAEQLTSLRLTD